MKTLKEIKIINWHYFWNEKIHFEQINFLTGLNASGKSTLIDAIQVVLLGDTSGRFFNKAAMEKSNRTLRGYLRGELGDALDGGFHYLRNGRFTSYIALEFYDDVEEHNFVLGIVFDSFEDGSQEHRFFFINGDMPENEFIVNKVPMDYKTLNEYLGEHYPNNFTFFDSNRHYQTFLKRQFGGLKDKYFSLLKKSVSFSPITDITTFITEYVCDPQENIDILPMQENILQYRKLEVEAQQMRKRIDQLAKIKDTHTKYKNELDVMVLNSYIVERAGYENDKKRLDAFYAEVNQAKNRLQEIDEDIKEVELSIAELNRRKMRLVQDKATSNTYRLRDELLEQIEEAKSNLVSLTNEATTIQNNLTSYISSFTTITQSLSDELSSFETKVLDKSALDELNLLQDAALDVLHTSLRLRDQILHDIHSLTSEQLTAWRDTLGTFKHAISTFAARLNSVIKENEQNLALLRQQELNMEQGGKSYPWTLTSIKRALEDELSARHNKRIKVEIYADLVDIRSDEWKNAIEGFLHNQKFNLFVDERYFLEAYEILRGLLDKENYYGTTLVDDSRIIERGYEAENNSLATEIITDHPGARAYTNYLIGRLYKANDIQAARNSGNGITVAGDLYRNFGFGKLNPRLYREHFIGRSIGQEQINAKKREISELNSVLISLRKLLGPVNEGNRLEIINTNEISAMTISLENIKGISGLKQNITYLNSELAKYDTSQLDSLQKRIDDIDEDIANLEKDRNTYFEEKGKLTNLVATLSEEKIPAEIELLGMRETRINSMYDPFLVAEKAEPAYLALVSEGVTPLAIITDYNVKYGHSQYLVNNIFSTLQKERRDYIREYRLSYDIDQTNNNIYDEELHDFSEVKLPEYEDKIHDAYTKAIHQFRTDFIAKLRGAIETVQDQIEDLNYALSASTFGNDSYQFSVRPSSTYRPYYDMITDDLLLEIDEDDSRFLDKYDDLMRELFAQIAATTDGDNSGSSIILRNVERLTDYRSYLDFDLIVKDKAGNSQRLSKMIKKKSGGETQTPFYISVLASFAQLYHVKESGELGNTVRLIIFDEAFSKMDSGRIRESIKLLRTFNLQAIISAPSDKISDVSEYVDETLVVLRGRNASHVRLYAEEDKLNIPLN